MPKSNFRIFIIPIFTPNALKLPKITQNQHEWHFQTSLTLQFSKIFNFLILGHFFYSTPANNPIDFFDYIPFCRQSFFYFLISQIFFARSIKLLSYLLLLLGAMWYHLNMVGPIENSICRQICILIQVHP